MNNDASSEDEARVPKTPHRYRAVIYPGVLSTDQDKLSKTALDFRNRSLLPYQDISTMVYY